jgi:hypothetical protein
MLKVVRMRARGSLITTPQDAITPDDVSHAALELKIAELNAEVRRPQVELEAARSTRPD